MLLMGYSKVGKTSMKSIIFSNYEPEDVNRLGSTQTAEVSHIRLLKNVRLDLYDCTGDLDYWKKFVASDSCDAFFSNVNILVFVFDASNQDNLRYHQHFKEIMDAVICYSSNLRIYCFLNKIDMIDVKKRPTVIKSWTDNSIGPYKKKHVEVHSFATSVFNESLYSAWTSIFQANFVSKKITSELSNYTNKVYVFDRVTLLALYGHYNANIHSLVKNFRKNSLQTRDNVPQISDACIIDVFTDYTYIMIIVPKVNDTLMQSIEQLKNVCSRLC